MRKRNTPEHVFARVDRDGPVPLHAPELGQCHLWKGCVSSTGYGRFPFMGRVIKAHRVAFFLAYGRWPDPFCCHRCDVRLCCNPAHLFEGSHEASMADMATKGRSGGDRHSSRTHPERVPKGEHHFRAKLSEQDVRDIRANYALCRVTQKELAQRFAIDQSIVCGIINRKRWAHVRP